MRQAKVVVLGAVAVVTATAAGVMPAIVTGGSPPPPAVSPSEPQQAAAGIGVDQGRSAPPPGGVESPPVIPSGEPGRVEPGLGTGQDRPVPPCRRPSRVGVGCPSRASGVPELRDVPRATLRPRRSSLSVPGGCRSTAWPSACCSPTTSPLPSRLRRRPWPRPRRHPRLPYRRARAAFALSRTPAAPSLARTSRRRASTSPTSSRRTAR